MEYEQCNTELAEILKRIARIRLCQGGERGRWSARQHSDAAQIVLNCGYQIKTEEQARELPRIGEGIGRKIGEFLSTGKLEELEQDMEVVHQSEVIGMFTRIPGVGFSTGQRWYQLGYRTKEDLKSAVTKGSIKLNNTQLVGLNYLDEISQKMTRGQMEGVANYIKGKVDILCDNYKVVAVGSYRRGTNLSKDVDIIIYPDPLYYNSDHCTDGIIEDLMRLMRNESVVFQMSDHSFMGLVEHNFILRRVDIWLAPVDQIVTMLVGRTANVETNKKLRIEATKRNMKLSNHGLYDRGSGEKLEVRSEKEIFDMFGIEKDYKPNFIYPGYRC